MNSFLFDRLTASKNEEAVIKLANKGQIVTSAEDSLKDPVVLEFLGYKEHHVYTENDLETAIINHLGGSRKPQKFPDYFNGSPHLILPRKIGHVLFIVINYSASMFFYASLVINDAFYAHLNLFSELTANREKLWG